MSQPGVSRLNNKGIYILPTNPADPIPEKIRISAIGRPSLRQFEFKLHARPNLCQRKWIFHLQTWPTLCESALYFSYNVVGQLYPTEYLYVT